MEKLDLLSVVLVLIGSIMVYGSKYIFKKLKINADGKKMIVFKLVGLAIAFIGFIRILDII